MELHKDILHAVERVEQGFSIRGTAKLFGIPKSTLEDRVKERYGSHRKGAAAILSDEEERTIVGWIISMAQAGFPVSEKILMMQVGEAAKSLGKLDFFKNQLPSRGWVTWFMKRHPELSKRVANNLAKRRVVLEEDVRQWFQTVGAYLKDANVMDVLDDPKRVYNMDESAFSVVPTKQRVIAPKGSKNVQSVSLNSEKENYTVLISASAAGKLAPPLVLFPYKSRIPTGVVRSVPKGWGLGRSDSGWMNSVAFNEFIVNVFYPWAVSEKLQFPILLFVDGHSSHATFNTVNFCRKKKIILVSLPHNSTHFMQPLDVAFFAPMKAAWQENLKMWRFEHQGAMISRADFAPLLEKTLNSMPNIMETLVNGFRKCGLVPFDENAINYENLADPSGAPASLQVKIGKRSIEPQDGELEEMQEHSIDASQFLNFLNSKLQQSQLEEFRNQRNNLVWTGSTEDTSLFAIWRNLVDEVEGPPDYLVIGSPLIVQVEDTIVPNNEDVLVMEQEDTSTQNIEFWDPSEGTSTRLERSHEEVNEENDLQSSVSANNDQLCLEVGSISLHVQNDSQACHNPDQIQEANSTASTTTNLSTRKRPFPSVTTSDAWMNIYETEERKKQLQEELKKQRIEERKAKKSRKRNKKKKIKTQKTGPVRRKKQSQKPKK